MLMVFGVVCTW